MTKTFNKGDKFAWGDSIQIAREDGVTVTDTNIIGKVDEMIIFTDCTHEEAEAIATAIGADMTFMDEA